MKKFTFWHGNVSHDIDKIIIESFEEVVTGRFGGSSESGAYKNEDGYMVIKPSNDAVLTVLFDAHTSNDSVVMLTDLIINNMDDIISSCNLPINKSIPKLQQLITSLLVNDDVRDTCDSLKGETAVLFCFQKKDYLWWLSVGDNSLYLFHDEYSELNQFRLNARVFYQWLGKANSLDLDIPCYSSGTIQLREGVNKILMLTDGVLEIEGQAFEDNHYLNELISDHSLSDFSSIVLNEVKSKKGRDNATILSWIVISNSKPLRPTR